MCMVVTISVFLWEPKCPSEVSKLKLVSVLAVQTRPTLCERPIETAESLVRMAHAWEQDVTLVAPAWAHA